MKSEKLGKLILEGLLIMEDGRLVVHDCAHVGSEGIHILADEDAVLLGLIPIHIKSSSDKQTKKILITKRNRKHSKLHYGKKTIKKLGLPPK